MRRKEQRYRDVAQLLGCSEAHARNIVGGRRSIDPKYIPPLLSLVSPVHAAMGFLEEYMFNTFAGPVESLTPVLRDAHAGHAPVDQCDQDGDERKPSTRDVPRTAVHLDGIVLVGKLLDRDLPKYLLPGPRYRGPMRPIQLTANGRTWTALVRNAPMNRLDESYRHVPFHWAIEIWSSTSPMMHLATLRFGGYGWAAKQAFRIEVHGMGFMYSDWVGLLQCLLAPYVRANTLRVYEAHIALDVEVPYESIIPVQTTKSPSGIYLSSTEASRSGFDQLTKTGIYIGGRNQVCVYDKLRQLEDCAMPPHFKRCGRPPHIADWSCCTRFEFRLRYLDQSQTNVGARNTVTSSRPTSAERRRSNRRGSVPLGDFLAAHDVSILGDVLDVVRGDRIWRQFGVADLRHVVDPGLMRLPLEYAKEFGFVAAPPTAKRAMKMKREGRLSRRHRDLDAETKKKLKDSKRRVNPIDAMCMALRELVQAGVSENEAEAAAQANHAGLYELLLTLVALDPINIGKLVDAATPALRDELRRALEIHGSWRHLDPNDLGPSTLLSTTWSSGAAASLASFLAAPSTPGELGWSAVGRAPLSPERIRAGPPS